MASLVQIAIAARSTAAAALRNAQQGIQNTSNAVRRSSFVTRQHTREIILVQGAYRDMNGRLRDSNGQFLAQAGNVRHVTTAYGHLQNAINSVTRALIRYTIASRLARSMSDGVANGFRRLIPMVAMFATKLLAAAVALPIIINLVGNLIPLVMLLAPAAGTAGLAMVALKMSMNGIKEALDAGLSGDTEEFNKQLAKLPHSAQLAVATMVDLAREWKRTQKTVQSSFFRGFREDAIAVSRSIQPIADRWLPKVANRFAEVRMQLAKGLSGAAKDGRLEGITRNLYAAFSSLIDVVKPIARVLLDVTEVAAPRFAALADNIRGIAVAFSDWIRGAKESGKLGEWLDKAMTTFGKLRDIGANVFSIISAIFKASGGSGDSALDQIERATAKIAEWANGGSGQGVIKFFSGVIGLLGQVAPAFEAWYTWFQGIVVAAKAAWDGITAIFRGAVNLWLSFLESLVVGAAKAFGWVPGLGPKLQAAAAEFTKFKNSVNAALDGIEDEVVNITYRSRVIGDRVVSGAQLSGTYSSGIGGRPSGGPGGSPKQVNEWGHEIVDFTKGMVYNSNQSKRMMQALAQGGGGNVTLQGFVGAGAGRAIAAMLNKLIASGDIAWKAGGNKVQVAR